MQSSAVAVGWEEMLGSHVSDEGSRYVATFKIQEGRKNPDGLRKWAKDARGHY